MDEVSSLGLAVPHMYPETGAPVKPGPNPSAQRGKGTWAEHGGVSVVGFRGAEAGCEEGEEDAWRSIHPSPASFCTPSYLCRYVHNIRNLLSFPNQVSVLPSLLLFLRPRRSQLSSPSCRRHSGCAAINLRNKLLAGPHQQSHTPVDCTDRHSCPSSSSHPPAQPLSAMDGDRPEDGVAAAAGATTTELPLRAREPGAASPPGTALTGKQEHCARCRANLFSPLLPYGAVLLANLRHHRP